MRAGAICLPYKGRQRMPRSSPRARQRKPNTTPAIKSSFSTALICMTSRWIPASTSAKHVLKKDDLIPHREKAICFSVARSSTNASPNPSDASASTPTLYKSRCKVYSVGCKIYVEGVEFTLRTRQGKSYPPNQLPFSEVV